MRQERDNILNISVATPKDIPKLCELLYSLFNQESEFTAHLKTQEKGLAAVIGGSSVGDILVARKNGEIVGMVNILYTISTALGERVALLEDMVVSPSARGQGIGSTLIDHAIRYAKEQGCKRITLLTDSDNKGAQRFYERHGFSKSSMTPFRLFLS